MSDLDDLGDPEDLPTEVYIGLFIILIFVIYIYLSTFLTFMCLLFSLIKEKT